MPPMSRHGLSRHLLPALVALLFLLPLVFMVTGSLRPAGAPPPTGLELVPDGATTAAYPRLFDLLPIGTYLVNSLVIVAVAVPLTILVTSLAAYGIRLLTGRARRLVLALTVALLMVPAAALWTTRFEVYRTLGFTDTLVPLVAPALLGTSPFYVLVYVWAYGRIAPSQLAAARLEGASHLRVWWRIAMPQVRAATLAVAVLAFTHHWGAFLDALLYVQRQDLFPLPLGLRTLQLLGPTDWSLLMAGAVLLTLPVVLAVLVLQRFLLDDRFLGGRRVRS